jgi:hypothetical protein
MIFVFIFYKDTTFFRKSYLGAPTQMFDFEGNKTREALWIFTAEFVHLRGVLRVSVRLSINKLSNDEN